LYIEEHIVEDIYLVTLDFQNEHYSILPKGKPERLYTGAYLLSRIEIPISFGDRELKEQE
jgi:hypothetical protein